MVGEIRAEVEVTDGINESVNRPQTSFRVRYSIDVLRCAIGANVLKIPSARSMRLLHPL